jgi:uncharacterized membrane protein
LTTTLHNNISKYHFTWPGFEFTQTIVEELSMCPKQDRKVTSNRILIARNRKAYGITKQTLEILSLRTFSCEEPFKIKVSAQVLVIRTGLRRQFLKRELGINYAIGARHLFLL